jgi:predicted RNA polymerase sigma factor
MKACDLVLLRRSAVMTQLDAWPFRTLRPNNPAGWMIQAIENNYEPPDSFRRLQREEAHKRKLELTQRLIDACALCDSNGYRQVNGKYSFQGVMRRCSHDARLESDIDSKSQNWTERPAKPSDEGNDAI